MAKEDEIEVANKKSLSQFIEDYLPSDLRWHPSTNASYNLTLHTPSSLSKPDFETCFNLIHFTSFSDYSESREGWRPKSKRREMALLDLKYLLVKKEGSEEVEGFCSFMPTYEDGYPVIYCYEIHLCSALQGSGLGRVLMQTLDEVAKKIPDTMKIMLTCFVCNVRGVAFYRKLGFEVDEYSPGPRILRNGTRIESDYVILSKNVSQ